MFVQVNFLNLYTLQLAKWFSHVGRILLETLTKQMHRTAGVTKITPTGNVVGSAHKKFIKGIYVYMNGMFFLQKLPDTDLMIFQVTLSL